MGKTALLTPLYISVAWTLMTSYQLFTETTVTSVTHFIQAYLPQVGLWLTARLDMVVFIHSFAWIFLLSSVIPSTLLGKERSVLMQFSVCLILAFLANIVQYALVDMGNGALDQILGLAPLFENPAIATAYLSMPYLMMLGLDMRNKHKRQELLNLGREQNDYPEDTFLTEDEYAQEPEKENPHEQQTQYPF